MIWILVAICATVLMYTNAARQRQPIRNACLWMGKPILDLGDGHLYNIVQAIHRGYWLKTGLPCGLKGSQRERLLDEYASRQFVESDIVAFEERNTKWRDKHETR